MPTDYTIRRFLPGEDLADAFDVRVKVFINEQGFDPALDIDPIDPIAHHLVMYEGGEPVATGRVFAKDAEPGLFAIGRVAVLSRCRGGTGRRIMEALESLAKELGATAITLGAQCQAEGFYARLGYEPYGDIFYDEFCPHINMRKSL